jgi:hypothetical protein
MCVREKRKKKDERGTDREKERLRESVRKILVIANERDRHAERDGKRSD